VKTYARIGFVVLTAMVLERALASELRLDGVAADFLLLITISAGIVAGRDDGAVVGFFAGLALDLMVQTPLGLGALVYCITGYLIGMAQGSAVRISRFQPVIFAAAGSAFGICLYVVLSLVVGRTGLINGHLVVVVVFVAVINALLIPLANRMMRWAFDHPENIRAAVR